jgi:hypothetical protein
VSFRPKKLTDFELISELLHECLFSLYSILLFLFSPWDHHNNHLDLSATVLHLASTGCPGNALWFQNHLSKNLKWKYITCILIVIPTPTLWGITKLQRNYSKVSTFTFGKMNYQISIWESFLYSSLYLKAKLMWPSL